MVDLTKTRDGEPDMESLLDAGKQATDRLQITHETLRTEVRRLTDELEVKNRELARKNRLADLGQMASHVAHEVRNCLVPTTLYLSLLRRRLATDPGGLELADHLATGLTELESTVTDLLQFSSQRPPRPDVFLLPDLLDDLFSSLAPQMAAQAVSLEMDVPQGTTIFADRQMVHRAVFNLILNALDVMPQGGEILVTAWSGSHAVELEIADSGPGLSPSDVARIFEPFFTTKSSGTGLGLAIVQNVAKAHHGSVTAANCPQGGAAFTLSFPRTTQRAAA